MAETVNLGDSTKFTREYFDSMLLETRHIDGAAYRWCFAFDNFGTLR